MGENVAGFTGLPGLEGFRPGGTATAWAPILRDRTWSLEKESDARLTLTSTDAESGRGVRVDVELTIEGLVRTRTHVTNPGSGGLVLTAVVGACVRGTNGRSGRAARSPWAQQEARSVRP